MNTTATGRLALLDHATRDDLRIYLERLQKAGLPEVRLVSQGSTIAVFGCTQAPAGLIDPLPVVLVMRAFSLRDEPAGVIDATVEGRALLDRLARLGLLGLDLELPDTTVTVAWAGVLPPHAGWEPVGVIDAASLSLAAEQGVTRIAEALPEQPGEAVVRTVRASVWGMEIVPGLPASAAFAAEALGFLRDEAHVRLSRTLTWNRLSTSRGHVMVRSLLG